MLKKILVTILCTPLVACSSSSDSSTNIPVLPPPTTAPVLVSLTDVPALIPLGAQLDFRISVSAPAGLRSNAFEVEITSLSQVLFFDQFDASEFPGCFTGATFCTATLTELLGTTTTEQLGVFEVQFSAFDQLGTQGSAGASITVF